MLYIFLLMLMCIYTLMNEGLLFLMEYSYTTVLSFTTLLHTEIRDLSTSFTTGITSMMSCHNIHTIQQHRTHGNLNHMIGHGTKTCRCFPGRKITALWLNDTWTWTGLCYLAHGVHRKWQHADSKTMTSLDKQMISVAWLILLDRMTVMTQPKMTIMTQWHDVLLPELQYLVQAEIPSWDEIQ